MSAVDVTDMHPELTASVSSAGSSAEAMASFRQDVERHRRQRASGHGQLQARPLGPLPVGPPPTHVAGAAFRRRSAGTAVAPTRTRQGRARTAGTMSAVPTTPGAPGALGGPGALGDAGAVGGSGEAGGQPQQKSRPGGRGSAWSPTEDEQLVRELFDGLLVEDIATAHQRTTGAIYSRASRMVPVHPQVPTGRRERVEWLREHLRPDAPPLPEELQGWGWRESLQVRRARRAERTPTSEPGGIPGASDVEMSAPAASTQAPATSTSQGDAAARGAAASRAVSKPVRHGKPWTPIENALLLRGLEQGQSLTRLAGVHLRRARSVLLHAERLLGIPSDTAQAQAGRMAAVQQWLREHPLPALGQPQPEPQAPVSVQEQGEPPARNGARWKTEEDTQLLRELAGPSPLWQIAEMHKRSVGALHARVHVLTPDLQCSAVTSDVRSQSAPTVQDLIEHTAMVRALLRTTAQAIHPGAVGAAVSGWTAPTGDVSVNAGDQDAAVHELDRDVLGARALETGHDVQADEVDDV